MVEDAGIMQFAGAQPAVGVGQLGGALGDPDLQRLVGPLQRRVGRLQLGGALGDPALQLPVNMADFSFRALPLPDLLLEPEIGVAELGRAGQGERVGIRGQRTTAVTTEIAAVNALTAPWAT